MRIISTIDKLTIEPSNTFHESDQYSEHPKPKSLNVISMMKAFRMFRLLKLTRQYGGSIVIARVLRLVADQLLILVLGRVDQLQRHRA